MFLDKERWQPLPVVTITEENEEAMANKLFKKALMKVGLKPPANEQVSSKYLIRCYEYLDDVIRGGGARISGDDLIW